MTRGDPILKMALLGSSAKLAVHTTKKNASVIVALSKPSRAFIIRDVRLVLLALSIPLILSWVTVTIHLVCGGLLILTF